MSVTRIAEKAGVSIATVSRVLNHSRPVNPKIAEMVHRAMDELQLTPRHMRRRSRARSGDQHGTIAIVSLGMRSRPWFEVPVIAAAVGELTRASQDLHMSVLMAEMPDPKQISPVLRRPEVDGAIVFISSDLTTKDAAVLREHLPVVRVLGGQLSPIEIDHIGPDNNTVGYIAGQYLLQQGLTDLAFLTNKPRWDLIKLRAQGFMAAAQDAGITPTMYLQEDAPAPLGFYGPRTIAHRDFEKLITRLADSKNGRIGLFVSRDEEAVEVYRVMREVGLEPGKDVVVVSCDNESVRLSMLHPRPASIDLGAAEIATHAVRRLAHRIEHKDEPPVRMLVNPRLVVGDRADANA